MRNLFEIVRILFVIYLFSYCSILFVGLIFGMKILHKNRLRRKFHSDIKREYYLPISILVPAYNEELVIIKSIQSLLNLDYKKYEIIIIDDGSVDSTSEILIEYFKLKKVDRILGGDIKTKKVDSYFQTEVNGVEILLVKKENGKKGDSINAGINVAKYGYVVITDADSILPKNTLEELIKPVILSSNTIAVGGCIKVINNYNINNDILFEKKEKPKLLIGIQELIYDRSFLTGKFLFNSINCNTNISGALGLFKKNLLLDIGGCNTKTVGEDMDLVMHLHKYCRDNKIHYEIAYNELARCYTQAPDNLKSFITQQRRWYTGLLQCLYNYRSMANGMKYGMFSLFAFNFTFIFEFLSPIIELVGLLVLIFMMLFGSSLLINLQLLLVYIIFCSLVSFASYMLRIYNENFEGFKIKKLLYMMLYCVIENIGFRQYINFKRLSVLFQYKKYRDRWNPIPRQEF